MKVYWLEQTEADLPDGGTGTLACADTARSGCGTEAEPAWLSARERVQLGGLRFAKRRADWQLGRWTAKLAVAACLESPDDLRSLAKIEVHPTPSGAPEIFLGNTWAPATISLSHRAGRAVCAVTPDRSALGCDLEVVEPHSDAFISDYFAAEEQALVAQAAPEDRAWLVTLLWSAKESALKALHAGLRIDTRSVIVTLVDALSGPNKAGEADTLAADAQNPDLAARPPDAVQSWRPLRVRHLHDQTFLGWWQHTGSLIRTVVATPPPARPRLLDISSTRSPSADGSDQTQVA